MTGDATLLRRDYRRQLGRFLDGAKRARAAVARFRTWARATASTATRSQRAGNKQNIESNEYANIVLDVIYYYEQARREGMTPLSASQARTLRAWVKRALPAYWTHSGYLNWDTGLYLYRWHLSRYWAWSCQGLLAIATSQNFVDDDERLWAKHIFDRSLALYERFMRALGRRPARAGQQPVRHHDQVQRGPALRAGALPGAGGGGGAARPGRQAGGGAAAAVRLRSADRPADRHDADLQHRDRGDVSNGAFPYGGIELARLFDSRQRVVSHIGGRAPAAMGLVVRDAERTRSSRLRSARGSPCRAAICR